MFASAAGKDRPLRGCPDRNTDPNAEEKDLVIIGGGVAGYVAAIKAGQEGMKVRYARIANSALAPALTHLALL